MPRSCFILTLEFRLISIHSRYRELIHSTGLPHPQAHSQVFMQHCKPGNRPGDKASTGIIKIPPFCACFQVISDVRNLSEKLLSVKGTDDLSVSAQVNATLLFSILLRATLCSKRTAEEHKLSQQAFEWVVGEIEAKFLQAKVSICCN